MLGRNSLEEHSLDAMAEVLARVMEHVNYWSKFALYKFSELSANVPAKYAVDKDHPQYMDLGHKLDLKKIDLDCVTLGTADICFGSR